MIAPEMKRIIAKSCWETGAFEANFKSPYVLRSGAISPIYVSTEQILGDPTVSYVCIALTRPLVEELGCDVVAGGETRGALFAKDLATSVGKPFVLVRKLPKDYGAGTQKSKLIQCMKEEDFAGKDALLTEDLITDGGSKEDFITGIRDTGGYVDKCLVFVDRQQGGKETLEGLGVELYSMTNLDTILDMAPETGMFDDEDLKSIDDYRTDPEKWVKDFKERNSS